MVRRSEVRAVERRGGGNQDRLDQIAIRQPEQEFPGGIFRAEDANRFELSESKSLGESFPELLGKIAHGIEGSDALLVDPIDDLFRAIGALVLRGQIGGDLIEKKRLNRWFAGRLHGGGYVDAHAFKVSKGRKRLTCAM